MVGFLNNNLTLHENEAMSAEVETNMATVRRNHFSFLLPADMASFSRCAKLYFGQRLFTSFESCMGIFKYSFSFLNQVISTSSIGPFKSYISAAIYVFVKCFLIFVLM